MEKDLTSLAVLIPAYKPTDLLIKLSQELIEQGFKYVLVVDDGSGDEFKPVFDSVNKAGCRVISHAVNMGKGRALKTGINDIMLNGSGILGVITADADGQHLVKDIINVGKALLESKDTLVLGKRSFKGKVPFKSRFGNTITKHVFNFVSGQKIHDTQTGLRGLPWSSLKDMMSLTGERYEYEMDMLLKASRLGLTLKEIDIETVYHDKNAASHFNPFKDSLRIYRIIVSGFIMFAGSSVFAFLIDFALFALLLSFFPQKNMLWLVVAGSRIPSATINFFINRNIVFAARKSGNFKRHAFGYFWLAGVIMLLNYSLIFLLSNVIGLYELVAKPIVEVILFLLSYLMQKRVVFKP